MKMLAVLLVAGAVVQAPPTPVMRPVGTMGDLMVKILYPASDAVFYITTRTPTTEVEWNELEGKALMLAEGGNLLMMPGRARDRGRWMDDARLLVDAGAAALAAAKKRDLAALEGLNEQLYRSCTTCHSHYRSNYRSR